MKKLFFAALLATVAVGGAIAGNLKPFITGSFYSATSNTPNITCNVGPALCSTYYSVPAYDKPASDPTRKLVNLSDYEHAL